MTPKLDTLVEQTLPSGRVAPLTIEQAQSIVDRNRADINSKEKGGVVKGQDGVTVPMTGTIAAIRPVTVAIRSSGDPRPTKEATISRAPDLNNPLARFTDEELAKAVMAGKYGNGAVRRKALGDRYAAVQSIINRGFRKPTQPTQSAQPAQNTT